MKKILSILVGASLLLAAPASAQNAVVNFKTSNTTPGSKPVTDTLGLPVNCIVGCSGGGGGTVTQGPQGTNAAGWWVWVGDGTNGPVAVSTAFADGTSNTINALTVGAYTKCWNGTTWDRCTQIGTGTPGTPNITTVLSVQGESSMTPLLVNPGTAANWGVGATASGVPANGIYQGINVAGNLRGLTGVNPSGSVYAAQTDITSVNAITVLTGTGATGTGSQRVTVATDTATIAGSAPGTAGTPSAQVVSVQGVASGTPQPVSGTVSANGASNVTLTDCSGTVATGGTAVNAFTAQTTLHGFTIFNYDTAHNDEVLWISFTTTAAASTAGSYPLPAPTATTFAGGGSYTSPPGQGTNHALSVIAATSGHAFSCTWW